MARPVCLEWMTNRDEPHPGAIRRRRSSLIKLEQVSEHGQPGDHTRPHRHHSRHRSDCRQVPLLMGNRRHPDRQLWRENGIKDLGNAEIEAEIVFSCRKSVLQGGIDDRLGLVLLTLWGGRGGSHQPKQPHRFARHPPAVGPPGDRMIDTVFVILRQLASGLTSSMHRAPSRSLPPVDTRMASDGRHADPTPHAEPPPFARWVYELDDEVTEYIYGQQRTQVLLQSERRTAAVKARQSARRQRETLPFAATAPAHS